MHTSRDKCVLVLDADQRSALAVTRSLGRRGIRVTVADVTHKTLAGASRYCSDRSVYPSPAADPAGFVDSISQIATDRRIRVVFPMTETTAYLLLEHSNRLGDVELPFPDFDTFKAVSDKCHLFAVAKQLGISIPHTVHIDSASELASLKRTFEYPLVIKPCRSRLFTTNGIVETSVRYAHSADELDNIVEKTPYLQNHGFMVQEFIHGSGQGLFALYNRGEPVCHFAHKRIREKPPTGGVSVLSQSVPVPETLIEPSAKLLHHFRWHGVAMVEFKVTDDGTPYLMEINPRFWGSLQLSITAGLDFPYLLYRILSRDDYFDEPETTYRNGVKLRWLLGDMDNLFITLKSRQFTGKEKLRSLINFFYPFDKNLHYEINRIDDFRPFIKEIGDYFKALR